MLYVKSSEISRKPCRLAFSEAGVKETDSVCSKSFAEVKPFKKNVTLRLGSFTVSKYQRKEPKGRKVVFC